MAKLTTRRSFFKTLLGAAAGALALELPDPERLLWTPGAKTILDMGANRPALERPTLDQVVHLSPNRAGQLLNIKTFDPKGVWITGDGLEKPIYLTDRFRLTVEGREGRWAATYDSDFKLHTINGQAATDDAIARHAQTIQRTIRPSRRR